MCTDENVRELVGLVRREDFRDVGLKLCRYWFASDGVPGGREDAHALADAWDEVGRG